MFKKTKQNTVDTSNFTWFKLHIAFSNHEILEYLSALYIDDQMSPLSKDHNVNYNILGYGLCEEPYMLLEIFMWIYTSC